MECPVQTRENTDLLLDYCAHRLGGEAAAALERHMEHCALCREFSARQGAVWSDLDVWEAEPVSPDFKRKLYARIEREERAGLWARLFGPWRLSLKPALPLAVASIVLMAAFLAQSPPTVPKPAQVETVDVEQVERALDDLDMLRQLPLFPRAEAAGSERM